MRARFYKSPQSKTPALGARVSRRMGEGLGAGGTPPALPVQRAGVPPVPVCEIIFAPQPVGYMLDTTELNAVAKGHVPISA
jgi:hypothetical protein